MKCDLQKNSVYISFPREVMNNQRSFEFLMGKMQFLKKIEKKQVIFDFEYTRYFETNLLVVISFIFEELENRENSILVKLRKQNLLQGAKALNKIFSYYSVDKRPLLKVRRIGIYNNRETEDVLVKYLKEINLKEYDVVKILISELFANIKMHTETKEGFFAAYISKRNNELIISVSNTDITIRQKLYKARQIEFNNDIEAITWALKKSNSTRDDDESGGLGLYLLRKYVAQINGRCMIISGSGFVEFDSGSYNKEQENLIFYTNNGELEYAYSGNMITLFVPYNTKSKDEKTNQRLGMLQLKDLR